MNLVEILIICLKNKRILLCVPLATAVLTFVAVSFLPKYYYTEMRLRVEDPNKNQLPISLSKDLSSFFGKQTQNEPSELYLELLGGRENLVAAIKEFKLDSIYKKKSIDLTLKKFKSDIAIDIEMNNVIYCGVETRDRERGIRIIKFLSSRANGRYMQLQKERFALNVKFLHERRSQLVDSLELYNKQLIAFYENNNVINIQEQIKLSLAALARYEQEAQALQIEKQFAVTTIGSGSPEEQNLVKKIAVLRQEFEQLRGQRGKDYKPQRNSVLVDADWAISNLLYEKIFQTRIEVAKDFLSLISKELAASESQLSRDIPVVQIIQDAYMPDWKVKPKRVVYLAATAALSFALVFSYVLLRAFMNGQIGSSSEMRIKFRELLSVLFSWK